MIQQIVQALLTLAVAIALLAVTNSSMDKVTDLSKENLELHKRIEQYKSQYETLKRLRKEDLCKSSR